MDFSIRQDWWKRPNNSKLLIDSLQSRGFQRSATFGNLDDIGYEESWMKNKIKVKVNFTGGNGQHFSCGFFSLVPFNPNPINPSWIKAKSWMGTKTQLQGCNLVKWVERNSVNL